MRTFLAVLLLSSAPAWAQSTFATITGVALDPSGSVVPNATIEITLIERNYQYTATSNEVGAYTFANIPNGRYSLQAKAAGFKDFRAENILLDVRENRRIDITFTIDAVTTTTVEVSAGAGLIETETARISNTKERAVLTALPLSLRRAWDYVTLTPMVDNNNWEFRLGGSRSGQTDATIDGTSLNHSGTAPVGPLMDRTESMGEMRIDVAQMGAESASTGQVTMVSRSGTNQFHGSAADYYSTPRLKARNPFQTRGDSSRGHTLSFSAGGPVYIPKVYDGRNKSFFFSTVEAGFGSGTDLNITMTVPPQAWRDGDFSALSTVVKDPKSAGAPFPGNRIPTNRINQVTAALQKYYPAPNFGNPAVLAIQNYREARPGMVQHQPTYTNRVDHRFSDKMFIFSRWTATRWNEDNYETGLPLIKDTMRTSRRQMDGLTLALTNTFSATVLNEARFGVASDRQQIRGVIDGNALAQQLGLQGLAPDLPPDATGMYGVTINNLGISGLGSTTNSWYHGKGITFNDNVSWFRGGHSLKFGMTFKRGNYAQQGDGNVFGSGTFTGAYTGQEYADFLLGIPGQMNRAYPGIYTNTIGYNYGVYATDEWKVRPNLTLTLGLRWDVARPQVEENDRLAIFDVNLGKIIVSDHMVTRISPLMPLNYVGVAGASAAGRPQRSLIYTDLNNIQPRFSFAYRPFGNNTVIRGGAGFYFDQSAPGAGGGVPFAISQPNYTNSTTDPLYLPQVFPAQGSSGPSTVSIPGAGNANLSIPRVLQSSFSIDHQRWDTGFHIGWIGNFQRNMRYSRNINQPVVDERLYVDKLDTIPFPKYPAINYQENGNTHNYNSFTAQVERRMKSGLYYQAYWTWARDIGTGLGEDARAARIRYVENTVPQHRFSTNVVYQLPFGKGKKFGPDWNRALNFVFGGWQISNIASLQSGGFLSPSWSLADPQGTSYTTGRNRPNRSVLPNQSGNPNLDDPTIYRWFNTQVYSAPAIGTLGNAQRGAIRGVSSNTMHSSASKTFVVRERLRIKTEFLVTNTLNHPNYRNPSTTASSTSAGVITNVQDRNTTLDTGIPRYCQLHLRLDW
jgi:hypothetical protein